MVLTAAVLAVRFHLVTARALNAQFKYTASNGSITITGYTGAASTVAIPSRINGLPVTTIGNTAFQDCTNLASVTIPRSVTDIEQGAFHGCINLTGIRVDEHNPAYSDVDGVLFNKGQSSLIQWPPGKSAYAMGAGADSTAGADVAGAEGETMS